jgi:hypothetical protein
MSVSAAVKLRSQPGGLQENGFSPSCPRWVGQAWRRGDQQLSALGISFRDVISMANLEVAAGEAIFVKAA